MQQCFDEYIEQIARIVFADPGATPLQRVRASVGGLSDPTARHVASFLIAVYDGLQVQWLLDPQRAPTADDLMAALEVALPAALAAEQVGSPSRTTNPPERCS